MKNKFLIRHPSGCIMAKCDSIEKANSFIDNHLARNRQNYQLLLGFVPNRNAYDILNLDNIPVLKNNI